ncbi:MAG: hypothetical protein Kow0092_20940 [Deferrisomatales bacterium]
MSASATAAYAAAGERLIAAVGTRMARRADIAALTGGNPLEEMFAHQRNHHRALASLLRFGRGDLLEQELAWAYRTYTAHGFSLEYFPAEAQAWVEAIRTHLSPTHAGELEPVYRWVLETHAARQAPSPPRPAPLAVPELAGPAIRLVEALLYEEAETCFARARAAAEEVGGVPRVYDEILAPVMREIGRRWETGEISVAQEHLATARVSRILLDLYRDLPLPGTKEGLALVSTAPGERHEVGARMVADLLGVAGWRVRYLGADTPAEDLAALAASDKPQLVVLSACVVCNLDRAADAVARIRTHLSPDRCAILVGGQAFQRAPGLWREVGADGSGQTSADAVALARALAAPEGGDR